MRTAAMICLPGLLLPAPIAAQESVPSGHIVVRGNGEASAPPDRARVVFSVVSRATLAAAVGADNAERQGVVMAALRPPELGVDELTTGAYSVQPRTRRDDNGNRNVVGYEARISISATTADLGSVGAIIDAALAAGVDQVDRVGFEVADAAGLRRQALANAVAEARASAETMARAAGGRLGRLVELSTENLSSRPVPVAEMGAFSPASAARGAAVPPELTPGEETAHATVIGRWEFIPAS